MTRKTPTDSTQIPRRHCYRYYLQMAGTNPYPYWTTRRRRPAPFFPYDQNPVAGNVKANVTGLPCPRADRTVRVAIVSPPCLFSTGTRNKQRTTRAGFGFLPAAYLRYSRLEMIRIKRSASGSLNDVRFSSTSSFKAKTRNSRACKSCVDRETTGFFTSVVANLSRNES